MIPLQDLAPLLVAVTACQPAAAGGGDVPKRPIGSVPAPRESANDDSRPTPLPHRSCKPPKYYGPTCPAGWGVCTICNPTGLGSRLVTSRGTTPFCKADGTHPSTEVRDAHGRVIEWTIVEPTDDENVRSGARIRRDSSGTITHITTRSRNRVTFARHDQGRMVERRVHEPCTSTQLFECQATNPKLSTWTYDDTGRLIEKSDPERGKVVYGFDKLGRLATVTDRNERMTLTYNSNQALATANTVHFKPRRGVRAPATTIVYNAAGFVTQVRTLGLSGAPGGELTLRANGLPSRSRPAAGHGHETTFDETGHVTWYKNRWTTAVLAMNPWGAWKSSRSKRVTERRLFDDFGSLISETFHQPPAPEERYSWKWSDQGLLLRSTTRAGTHRYDTSCLDQLRTEAPPRPAGAQEDGMTWDGAHLKPLAAETYRAHILALGIEGYRLTARGKLVPTPPELFGVWPYAPVTH